MECEESENPRSLGIEKLLQAVEDEGGKPAAIAKRLTDAGRECTRQIVEYWIKQGYVPGKWAPFVAQEFGIPLHELNPEIYPAPNSPVARLSRSA